MRQWIVLPFRRVYRLLNRTARDLWSHNVLGLAAQTAYFCFYSLFPILLFCASILSLVGDRRQTFDMLLNTIAPAAPPAALDLIESVLHDIVYVANAPGLLSIGAVLALWSGSNIFAALADALNRAAGVRETRPIWKILALAMTFVIAAGIAAAVATPALLFGGTIVDALANQLNLQAAARLAWLVSQTGVVILLLIGLGTAVFHFLPSQRLAWREAFIGSSVATTLWLIVTVGFRIYLYHFPTYNEAYGAIGAVIVLLTWMYLSMLSLITGGQLAAELHRERSNPSIFPRIEVAAPQTPR